MVACRVGQRKNSRVGEAGQAPSVTRASNRDGRTARRHIMRGPMSGMPPGDDLRADPDVPGGIRYDPDLAVHEPIPVPQGPIEPSRRRSPLLLLPVGIAALCLIIYLVFGLIAHEGKRSSDYLGEIRLHPASGGAAAFELSRMVTSEDPRRRDARFVPDLLALIKESREMEDPGVRRYLALTLGELRDPRAVEALEDSLHDSDLQTRIYAVWSLGAIGEARAAPVILPLLSAEEPDLRKIAAY